jgi:hypothetical protein
MNIWKKLFGGGSKPAASILNQPTAPQLSIAESPPAGKEHAVISGSSKNTEDPSPDMLPILRLEGVLTMLEYDGGPGELYYERLSTDLIRRHGSLVGVDYVSHWPKFEIWFRYKDGAAVYSGQRTGHYDIHFLTMGYVGQGPRYARHFLSAAGFDLTYEQIESVKPGDSIELKDGKTIIVREKDKVVETQEVVFDHEEKRIAAGLPAIFRYYKGPSKAAAEAFLMMQNVTARSFFLCVKVPEGMFCKDCDGPFEA